MPVADDEVAALRALLKGDVDRHNELFSTIDRDRVARYYTALISAAFGVAVMRRFGKSHTHRDMIEFVAETRAKSENLAARIDPDAGEKVIGAVLGEATTQGLAEDAKFDAQFQLLVSLAVAEHLEDAGLDAFLSDARNMADEMIEARYGASS